MRKALFLGVVLLVLGTGCPRPRFGYDFTSADMAGRGFWGGLDAAAGYVEGDAEGTSEPREVVEPDVFRLNGNILYVLNQYRGLTLVDLDANTVLGQVPTYGYPRDLYVRDGLAYVLVGYAPDYNVASGVFTSSMAARVYVVNVAEPAQAKIVGRFDLEGDFVDSRLVGDVLYAVCADFEWYWIDGEVQKAQTTESWVSSINVADPTNVYLADDISFLGYGNVIQATPDAIFVAAPMWNDWWSTTTVITYVDISNPIGMMAARDSVTIKGAVADRFKMDAHNGVLRVVSSGRQDDARGVFVTTVDLSDPDNLDRMGEFFLEDAIGETLFATRFDGDRAYIVTYFMVDPLFVVDLSDPANPAVTGMVEVPGWSTHIEPRGNRLIALGVDDQGGRRVKVSLFDVADPAAPAELDTVSFGSDWSWSSAYSDVKAFTVLDDVLIVPFSGWTEDFGGFQRLQFVSYDDVSLAKRGYIDVDGEVLRSFEYGGTYYGVTTEQLATIDAADLDAPVVTDRLVLAESVVDFLELSPEVGVKVIASRDDGKVRLDAVGLPLKNISQVAVDIGTYHAGYVYGDSLVLVGTTLWERVGGAGYDYTSYYSVAAVDYADPAAPIVSDTLRINVEPFYGYYWPVFDVAGGSGGIAETAVSDDRSKDYAYCWSCPYITYVESTFLMGDLLVLRCRADAYDTTFGDEAAYQGLALVDLARGQWTTTVGLGYTNVVSLDAAGGKLYVGTKTGVGWQIYNPVCAYFVRELDVAHLSMGPAANIPGTFVQYDPGNNVLTLLDQQWTDSPWNTSSYEVSLVTASWDGADSATEIDRVSLNASAYPVLGRGPKV
ncbi:MAG TPA: hypothetical protein HPP83_06250, partial [Candidatus Hydrogenedentes bacterium]|nr:hypothetical protein [Candidatus Hydrogenedentota bacterium]